MVFPWGNRTFVKFQPQDNCLKSIWYNCLKSYSTIVKLFANKFIASQPYSTIVKKVHSHTGKLSKTSQMIFTEKNLHLQGIKISKKVLRSQPYSTIVKNLHGHTGQLSNKNLGQVSSTTQIGLPFHPVTSSITRVSLGQSMFDNKFFNRNTQEEEGQVSLGQVRLGLVRLGQGWLVLSILKQLDNCTIFSH